MSQARCTGPHLTAADHVFNTATVAVAGLYLATHSVVVTITGTVAAIALRGWSMWLSCLQDRSLVSHRALSAAAPGPDEPPPGELEAK